MYAGMPLSRTSSSSPGPLTTNQPSPTRGATDAAATIATRPRRRQPVRSVLRQAPWAAITAATTNAAWMTSTRKPSPALVVTAARSNVTSPSATATTAAASATIQHTSTGTRVRAGTRASTAIASTASPR